MGIRQPLRAGPVGILPLRVVVQNQHFPMRLRRPLERTPAFVRRRSVAKCGVRALANKKVNILGLTGVVVVQQNTLCPQQYEVPILVVLVLGLQSRPYDLFRRDAYTCCEYARTNI